MKKRTLFTFKALLPALCLVGFASTALADAKLIAEGEKLTFSRKKGNCIACHAMPTADPKKATLPGDIGPPLIAIKARYTQQTLFNQIWDASAKNPLSIMPPFGKHKILSEDDIKAIAAYILTL